VREDKAFAFLPNPDSADARKFNKAGPISLWAGIEFDSSAGKRLRSSEISAISIVVTGTDVPAVQKS